MPIPDANRDVVAREKIEDYLLNEEHPEGGSKAVWFSSLGYERHDWRTICCQSPESAMSSIPNNRSSA